MEGVTPSGEGVSVPWREPEHSSQDWLAQMDCGRWGLSTPEPIPEGGVGGRPALRLGNPEPEYMECGVTGHRS